MLRKITFLVVLLFVISVSGCANMKTEEQQGTAIGGGAGALIGAIVGYAIGGKDGALLGAAIGGVGGAAAGYAYGNHIGGKKAEYAKTEDWLDACVADAHKVNQEMATYNQELSTQIVSIEKETAQLKKKKLKAKTKQAQLKEKQDVTNQLLAKANTQLEAAKKELEAQQHISQEAKKEQKTDYAVSLDSEVEGLKANITELEKRTKDLASLSASMSV